MDRKRGKHNSRIQLFHGLKTSHTYSVCNRLLGDANTSAMRKEEKSMTKKLLALMVTVLMVAGLMAPLSALASVYVSTPNGGGLNLREAPDSSSRVLLVIPYGDEFYVYDNLGNGWVYGHWGGEFGYVQSRYLSNTRPGPVSTVTRAPSPSATTNPEDEKSAEEAKLRNEINSEKDVSPFYVEVRTPRSTSWVNFRKGPSKITTRLATYPDGQQLIVEGETKRWYRARDPESNVVGYIFKDYTRKINKTVAAVVVESPAQNNAAQKLGTLTVNGAFELTCKLPEGYDLQVVNVRGGTIVASVLSQDMTKPQLYLSIAFDELYGDVQRMNDLTDDQLAALEATYTEMNDVDISYQNTSHGTKLLIAREIGSDTDFVDILSIYKGYMIEFNMTPNPSAASQTLTNAQIGMCIDFLSDLEFVPVQ